MKGKIIVIEGTDCSGKETQSVLLEKKLSENGVKCIRFEFPNYKSPTGKIVGGAYLGRPEISPSYFEEGATYVDPHIACLYYAADRKYNIKEIEDYLDKGYYVIIIQLLIWHIRVQKFLIKMKGLICINGLIN